MPSPFRPPLVPAAFFGIVLGLGGLTGAWRAAHRVWGLPALIGEVFMVLAVAVWAIVLALFLVKWLVARDAALAEARHPVQGGLLALAGVSTMLVATLLMPYSRAAASVLFITGLVPAIAFGVWYTGRLWQGGRAPETTTPVLYLPTVGLGYLSAIGLSAFGQATWAEVAFGVGVFTWIAIESVLFHRLFTAAPMAPPLRPTLGIQLAPPTLGSVTYLAMHGGMPDGFVHAMLGYGIFIALVLLRMLPWILEEPFSASYWGFTFGITSLAAGPLMMLERGDTGAIAILAPVIFVACNLAMAVIIVGTLRLIVARRLLPPVAR